MSVKKIECAENFESFIRCAESGTSKNDLADVSGIAYSGGEVSQFWSNLKLVVDLSGMTISPQIPLLYNHRNDPEFRLGEVVATIDGGKLHISGGVDKDTERGKFIVDAGKKFNWQLSIGAEISAVERVNDNEVRNINGREFSGPFLHVNKTCLREISVCAVGADPETTMKIAASLNITNFSNNNEGVLKTMTVKKNEKDLQAKIPEQTATEKTSVESAPVQSGMSEDRIAEIVAAQIAERERIENERKTGILAACGSEFASFAQEAITAGYSIAETSKIVAALKAHAEAVPATGPNIIVAKNPEINAQVLEAALCFNQGIPEENIVSSYAENVVEAGNKMRGITLRELIRLCASLENRNVPATFGNDTISAAFSTVSLPGILGNVANKKLLQSFAAQNIIATKLCRAGDLADFKESERYRLTDVGDLELVADGAEIKHGSASEDKATNKLETFGKIFTLTRQMIYNDDLNAFLTIPKAMGQRAARKIDQLFHERLLSNPAMHDGKLLFSAEHENILTGANSALSLESLGKAKDLFLMASDSDGQPLNIAPKYLFVPSCLDTIANNIVASPTIVGGTTAAPAFNVLSKYGLEVVSSPYLQRGCGGKAGSSTGWYLFGDPEQIDTFEIGYLQGRRVPTVEQGEINFNTLGMSFRVVFDLGVREQAYQGMTFSKGVA